MSTPFLSPKLCGTGVQMRYLIAALSYVFIGEADFRIGGAMLLGGGLVSTLNL